MSGNNIKVVCRFRPQNKREIAEGGVIIVDVDDDGQNVRLDVSSYCLWTSLNLRIERKWY